MDLRALKEIPLFKSVPADLLDRLVRNLPVVRFPPGITMIHQGEKRGKAYLFTEGKIAIFTTAHSGARTTLFYQKAPTALGLIELLQEKPYLGSIETLEPVEAIELSRVEYMKLLQSHHQVCLNMVSYLSNIIYQTGRERRILLFGGIENRLAHTLCSMSDLFGEEHTYGVLLTRELNKTELARNLGVARRSVIRAIRNLENQGLIQIHLGQLVIPSVKALMAKASEPLTH